MFFVLLALTIVLILTGIGLLMKGSVFIGSVLLILGIMCLFLLISSYNARKTSRTSSSSYSGSNLDCGDIDCDAGDFDFGGID
jgi:hypothetical protein